MKRSAEQKARMNVNKVLCEPIVSDLMDSLKKHDKITFCHCCDVAFMATQIAVLENLDKKMVRVVTMGALLHDIGKLKVSEELLNRVGFVSERDFNEIKRHPSYGYEMVKDLPLPLEVKNIIKHHHEKLDGTGYPDGLTEKDIPFYVRCVSVCDAYDAMISKRPYKEGYDKQCAMAELGYCVDTDYDERVIRLLENVACR